MPFIEGIATAVPKNRFDNDEIAGAADLWLFEHRAERELFRRFLSSSETQHRNFVRPLSELLSFNGMSGRAKIFEKEAPALGVETVEKVLTSCRRRGDSLGTFLFTSCTCPVIPSVDGVIVQQAKLSPEISRIPIYQHGCAGGIIGLSLANRFAREGRAVLLSSLEFCSLVFQPGDHSAGHLVGAAIFGDGAASVIVGPDEASTGEEGSRRLYFIDSCSTLLPNSRHLMGYDLLDDGSHLRLDKELPSLLAAYVPKLVPEFLERNDLRQEEVRWWLFHPGGAKILTFLEEAFDLEAERGGFARNVLRTNGNLSSASVLFVLADFLNCAPYERGDRVLMVGVGPGLTVEQILFEVR